MGFQEHIIVDKGIVTLDDAVAYSTDGSHQVSVTLSGKVISTKIELFLNAWFGISVSSLTMLKSKRISQMTYIIIFIFLKFNIIINNIQ